jgi:hypothetical protein
VDRYAKAIVGAVLAGLGSLGAAFSDGRVSANEWIVVATAAVTALSLIWAVPNSTTTKPPQL